MFKVIMIAGAMAAFPVVVHADGAAPVAGAATGAAAGAVVGGPVGAVIGGVGGAIIGGMSADRQPRFRRYVDEQGRPSYNWNERVVVGAELPPDVTYWDVPPEYGVTQYRYTIVDNTPVLVDPHTRRIVQVIGEGPAMGAAGAPAAPGGVVVGMSDDQRTRFDRYVDEQHVPSYQWNEKVTVGAELPSGVTFRDVPSQYGAKNYRYTVVNGVRVLVDPHTRRVVQVMGEGPHDVHGEIRNNGTMTGDRDVHGAMSKDRTATGDRGMSAPETKGAPGSVEGRAAWTPKHRQESKDNSQPQQQ